jgi:hypothetical protein
MVTADKQGGAAREHKAVLIVAAWCASGPSFWTV